MPPSNDAYPHRGAPMVSKSVAVLFADLGVTASFSRPRVSDDNPFSESHFRTAKDDWAYPGRFETIGHAHSWCRDFLRRYNTEHRHSSLAMLTPEQVFTGQDDDILTARHAVLMAAYAAYAAHPERFVNGPPPPRLGAERGLDQPAAAQPDAGGKSVNPGPECLNLLDTFRASGQAPSVTLGRVGARTEKT